MNCLVIVFSMLAASATAAPQLLNVGYSQGASAGAHHLQPVASFQDHNLQKQGYKEIPYSVNLQHDDQLNRQIFRGQLIGSNLVLPSARHQRNELLKGGLSLDSLGVSSQLYNTNDHLSGGVGLDFQGHLSGGYAEGFNGVNPTSFTGHNQFSGGIDQGGHVTRLTSKYSPGIYGGGQQFHGLNDISGGLNQLSGFHNQDLGGFSQDSFDHQVTGSHSQGIGGYSGSGGNILAIGHSGQNGAGHQCAPGSAQNALGRCVLVKISRNIFFFNTPALPPIKRIAPKIPDPRVNLNYVFVKTSDPVRGPKPIVAPPAQQKTMVVLLSKQQQAQRQEVIEVQSLQDEPEVFFVNYQEGENPQLPGGIDLQTALAQSNNAQLGGKDTIEFLDDGFSNYGNDDSNLQFARVQPATHSINNAYAPNNVGAFTNFKTTADVKSTFTPVSFNIPKVNDNISSANFKTTSQAKGYFTPLKNVGPAFTNLKTTAVDNSNNSPVSLNIPKFIDNIPSANFKTTSKVQGNFSPLSLRKLPAEIIQLDNIKESSVGQARNTLISDSQKSATVQSSTTNLAVFVNKKIAKKGCCSGSNTKKQTKSPEENIPAVQQDVEGSFSQQDIAVSLPETIPTKNNPDLEIITDIVLEPRGLTTNVNEDFGKKIEEPVQTGADEANKPQ